MTNPAPPPRPPWRTSVTNILKSTVRFFYHRACDTVSVLELCDSTLSLWPKLREGRKCQKISVNDLKNESFACFGHNRLERAHARLKSCHGVAIWEQNRPVGWGFITTNAREREGWPPLTYTIRPGPGMAYLFDVFVVPEFRGHGMAKDIILCCARLAAETGSTTFFLTHSHPAMAKIMRELGFCTAGKLTFLRILGFSRLNTDALRQFDRGESCASQAQKTEKR